MAEPADKPESGSSLDPIDRLSELMFGLIIAIAFIATVGLHGEGVEEPRVMLLAAAGLTLAWSVIDAVMYLIYALGERGTNRRLLRRLRRTRSDQAAMRVLVDALPELIADALPESLLVSIAADLRQAEALAPARALTAEDFRAAGEVFALEFVAMVPVILPFLIFSTPAVALAVSLGIAVTMLAVVGYFFGKSSGYRPVLTSGLMVTVGLSLAGVAWLAEG